MIIKTMRNFIFICSILIILLKTGNVLSENNIFNVNNIEINKKTYKNKEKIIDEAFKKGFKNLIKRLLIEDDFKKVSTSNLNQIKNLISYYQIKQTVKQKEGVDNVIINVFFDRDKLHDFFHARNILYSDIINSEIIIFPLLIKANEYYIYNKNYFYDNWNKSEENFENLVQYVLPVEKIENIERIETNKQNIFKIDISEFFEEYDNNNKVFSAIEVNDKNAKIFLNTIIEGKKLNKTLKIDGKNLDEKQFYDKIIFTIKNVIEDLVKSQNLIDVRTPSFLNVKIKLEKRKKNNFFEFNNRLKKIDLIDSFYVQELNKDYVLIKIRYLGKINKIIKKLEDQNMNLKMKNDEWELNII